VHDLPLYATDLDLKGSSLEPMTGSSVSPSKAVGRIEKFAKLRLRSAEDLKTALGNTLALLSGSLKWLASVVCTISKSQDHETRLSPLKSAKRSQVLVLPRKLALSQIHAHRLLPLVLENHPLEKLFPLSRPNPPWPIKLLTNQRSKDLGTLLGNFGVNSCHPHC